jgi:hypothetical protein
MTWAAASDNSFNARRAIRARIFELLRTGEGERTIESVVHRHLHSASNLYRLSHEITHERKREERVRNPWAIVALYRGSLFARSRSRWIHWRSSVASANCLIRFCVRLSHPVTRIFSANIFLERSQIFQHYRRHRTPQDSCTPVKQVALTVESLLARRLRSSDG